MLAKQLIPTESILAQALPGSLAAPAGWRSEILDGSSSPLPDEISGELTNTHSNAFEKHDEYRTLKTSDAPPIIFSSTHQTHRTVNEIPSSHRLPPRIVNRSNSTLITNEANDSYRTYIGKDQENILMQNLDQELPPVILHKTLPNNTVTYEQNVSVRYLQPPTPPPPGPIIIREVRPPPQAPPSPIQVRQRPPPPATPPPIVIREKPPPAPPQLPSQVVEKVLPPPPRPPRRMIVERFGSCPPKPADVVIERWLPYRRTDRRKVFFERAPTPLIRPMEPNLLILHDAPHARVHKEFINQGVTRADPITYLQRYGSEIDSWHHNSRYAHLINEADRALPPPHPSTSVGDRYGYQNSYSNPYPSSVATVWDRMRSASPPSYSPSYHDDSFYRHSRSSPYHHDDSFNRYSRSSPYHHDDSFNRYSRSSPYHHDDHSDHRTMIDVTPSWGRYCQSRLPSYNFSPLHRSNTLQVNSQGELDHVLSNLTRNRTSSSYHFY